MRHSFTARLKQFWREDGIFLCLMLGLFALRTIPAFSHGALYAPFRDNVWIYGPIFSHTSEIALTGEFPYWLDTILGGFPLYLTPHFSATYPFYFFGLLDYGRAVGSLYTLSYVTCFHVLILYFNLYVMLRVAGAKGLAALCGATIGLISGNTQVYTHWITITASYAWFPLLIAAMIRLLRTPLSFWNIAFFSITAALICTASPSQAVIHSALVSAVFFLAGSIWLYNKAGLAAVGRLFAALAIAAALAFALAAVAFLPMTLATGEMIRHVGNHPPLLGHASLPWESFNQSQLVPRDFVRLFLDPSDPHVVGGLYIGPFALLGLGGCMQAYRRTGGLTRFLIAFFAVMALYFLLAGFGTHFGISYLHFHIPLLNRIREAGRYLVLFTTFAVLLCGLGLQAIVDLVEGKESAAKTRYRFLCFVTIVCLAAFIFAFASYPPKGAACWLVLALLPVAFGLLPEPSLRKRLIICSLLLLACLASVLAPNSTQPFSDSSYLSEKNLNCHRVLSRLAQLPDIHNYRVAVSDKELGATVWGNNASYYGIRTFYAMITPQPYAQFLEMFDDRFRNLRELRGAKYFVCGTGATPLNAKARLIFTESGYRVYEVPNAMEEYALRHEVKMFIDAQVFRAAVVQGFDFQRIAALPSSPTLQSDPVVQKMQAEKSVNAPVKDVLHPIIRTANSIRLQVESDRPGILILNERWSPNWHAMLNSRRKRLLMVNFNQVGLILPAGTNAIGFEYKPTLFWDLLLLQRATFGLLLLAVGWKLCRQWAGTSLNRSVAPTS